MTNTFGVGIITTQDRQLHPNYMNLIDQSTNFAVEVDKERRGISRTRNRVLKNLYDQGCDHIVLFDDDCYPIKRGWQTYLDIVHYTSGAGVLVMPKDDPEIISTSGDVNSVQWGIGSFTSLTRRAIDTIGYFNTEYDTYGYEDVGYLFRARRAGLTVCSSGDSAPRHINDYIYSIDCDVNRVPVPETLSQENKAMYIAKNGPVFDSEVSSSTNYYPFVG